MLKAKKQFFASSYRKKILGVSSVVLVKQEKTILFSGQDFPQAESKSFCHGLHEFHRANLDFVKFVESVASIGSGRELLLCLAVGRDPKTRLSG